MALAMKEENRVASTDEEMMTPEDIARWLVVSNDLVYKWLNTGELFGYHLGKLWRVPKKAVDEFLLRRSNGNQQQGERIEEIQ